MTLPFTPLVKSLPASVPFVGPETQERLRERRFRARLGANESAFGPSPRAVAAMADAASEVWKYGDPENHDLRHALADHHGVAPDRIAIGEGIDGLLGLIVRLFSGAGTPIVTSAGAYPTFLYHVVGFGARPVTVPYRDDCEDPDALLAATRESRASLVYLANPDNPMGTWHDRATVAAMVEGLPDHAILCLDEAYVEFAPTGVALEDDFSHPRLIRLRTFSKAHGMARARVGYAITTPDIAAAFDKVRNHFGMNRMAQAGALAALSDPRHMTDVTAKVARAKRLITNAAKRAGLGVIPSATNFVSIDTWRDGAFARALVQALAVRDVFVRMPSVAPQDRCIRVSAGPDNEIAIFAKALVDAVAVVEADVAE